MQHIAQYCAILCDLCLNVGSEINGKTLSNTRFYEKQNIKHTLRFYSHILFIIKISITIAYMTVKYKIRNYTLYVNSFENILESIIDIPTLSLFMMTIQLNFDILVQKLNDTFINLGSMYPFIDIKHVHLMNHYHVG